MFQGKYYRLGLVLWILSAQYYLIQFLVASKFSGSFSLLHNTISDLGNTYCGPYGVRAVCSPLHPAMNASFLMLGITMIAGSLCIGIAIRKNRLAFAGLVCIILAGLGTILVGLFPENTVAGLHVTGAGLAFVFGNIALLFFSYGLKLPLLFRYITRASGLIALIALVLFLRHDYVGLDIGGLERIVAYPQSIWLTIYGIYRMMSRDTTN